MPALNALMALSLVESSAWSNCAFERAGVPAGRPAFDDTASDQITKSIQPVSRWPLIGMALIGPVGRRYDRRAEGVRQTGLDREEYDMPSPIFHVNAFSDRRFGGNPAAVCLLDEHVEESTLQDIASQMNLSETAFLQAGREGYDLRWFTPRKEVDLCGHATLASAHILWSEGYLPESDEAVFHTRSGRLSAGRDGDRIELDFPSRPASPAEPPRGLLDALGGPAPEAVAMSERDWLVEYGDSSAIETLRPAFNVLLDLDACVIVTARCAGERGDVDFISRFFAPSFGIDEDPVTGSAHCVLGPWWAARLGRSELHGEQVSSRGGHVHVRVDGGRTYLGGSATTVLRGTIDFEISPAPTA